MFGADSGENLENGITSYHAVLSFTLFAIKSTQHPIDLEIPEGHIMYWGAQLLASQRKDLLFFCFSFGMHACQTRVTFTKFQTFSSSAGICWGVNEDLNALKVVKNWFVVIAFYLKRSFLPCTKADVSAMRVGMGREKTCLNTDRMFPSFNIKGVLTQVN